MVLVTSAFDDADWSKVPSSDSVYLSDGHVGIGTNTPLAPLHIKTVEAILCPLMHWRLIIKIHLL